MVPLAAAEIAVTRVKLRVDEGFIVPKLQVTLPVPPTAGVVHTAPGGVVSDTEVVCAGTGATTVTLFAMLAPELVTEYEVVRFEPAFACWGACAAMESPGRNAPNASTSASPPCPSTEPPAAITRTSTMSPIAIEPAVPGTSTTCQPV